jgi:hypothetical protein
MSMKFAATTMLAVGAALFTANAMAQEGQPCAQAGAIYTINGKQYKCVASYGQAHNPNWDGRSREPSQPAMMGQPQGISTQQAVFPGLSDDSYKRLQNSPQGRALIKEADGYRAQQAQAQQDFKAAARAGNAEQLRIANQNLTKVNGQLDNMQKRAQKILVELQ